MADDGFLFSRDGDWYVPTLHTTGPWRPDAMHGGPPSALLALVIEGAAEADEHIARINVELERPVPVEPLRVELERRKLSRRVAHIDVQLWSATSRVASAHAVLLRGSLIPERSEGDPLSLPGAEMVVAGPPVPHGAPIVFHRDAVEHRVVEGGFSVPGRSVMWMRLRPALMRGEPTSGLCQLMALADFGSPISQPVIPPVPAALINIDVNVTMHRRPVGPWFCLNARCMVGPEGIGVAITELHDQLGAVGVTTQSQLPQPFNPV